MAKGIPMRARLRAQDKIVRELEDLLGEKYAGQGQVTEAMQQQIARIKKLFQMEDE